MRLRRPTLFLALAAISTGAGCSSEETGTTTPASSAAGTGGSHQGGSSVSAGGEGGTSSAVGGGGAGTGGVGGVDPGPNVDLSDPQLYTTEFTPDEADPAATDVLGIQPAYLDTRVTPLGLLVVYLHGAGTPSTCGSEAHEQVLAGLGFHVIGPCYVSGYGVDNCGDDIEGCRLEAFEGVDHHPFIDVTPPNSIEVRVAKSLAYLQTKNPEGDWTWFLDGDKPKWSKIVISGISHGASTSGVIGLHRVVKRAVMLSGPLDTGQAWLKKPTMTPIDVFFGFTHTADTQHPGHLQAFEDMGLVGMPTSVDGEVAPFGGSHRLETSAPTSDGHSSLQAGGSSPKNGSDWVFLPAWKYLYVDG